MMNTSEIEPIIDKVTFAEEFYLDYFKRVEIETHQVLLGIITDPEDIREYHATYKELTNEVEEKRFKNIRVSIPAQRLLKLFDRYNIEIIRTVKHRRGEWQPLRTQIVKDGQIIAEIG